MRSIADTERDEQVLAMSFDHIRVTLKEARDGKRLGMSKSEIHDQLNEAISLLDDLEKDVAEYRRETE